MSPVDPILVETDRALGEAAEQWREATAVALDTEFVRTRTFFARLGLVQVATDEQIWLVDPLQLDPAPIVGLMNDRNVVKIFHSCSEDLEVLHKLSGDFPQPLFDTQMAAAFAGHGYSLGYSRLVERFHSVELPKGETRTDWTRRPLSSAQLRYAALDVLYLLPIYRRLQGELDELGRSDWLLEDLAGLMNSERFLPDPQKVYRKIKGGGRLNRRQRALLRNLAAWRELEARRRDLPRNFVVREQVLIDIAQRQPEDSRQLLRIDGIDHGAARRFGDHLLQLVEKTRAVSEGDLPPALPPGTDLRPYKSLVAKMRKAVTNRAQQLDLPPELLANRRTVESTLRRLLDGAEPVLPKALRGWRETVIGERLVEIAATA